MVPVVNLGEGARTTLRRWADASMSAPHQPGTLLAIHQRSILLTAGRIAKSHPDILVIGASGLDPGPLMVEINSSPGISFTKLGLTPHTRWYFFPRRARRTDNTVWILSVDGCLDITLPASHLEKASPLSKTLRIDRGHLKSPWSLPNAHRLLRTLLEEDLEDGLGWLPHLFPLACERRVAIDAPWLRTFYQTLRRGHWPPGPLLDRILGQGPGLTPSGDDILAGLLLSLHGLSSQKETRAGQTAWVNSLLHRAQHRTSIVSIAFLRQAATGRASQSIIALLKLICRPWEENTIAEDVIPLLYRINQIGHTSGIDVIVGALLGTFALGSKIQR